MYVSSLFLSDNIERRNEMTIYMVIGNNGEPFEDNYEWNDRAFKTRESAEAYVAEKEAELFAEKERRSKLLRLSEQGKATADEEDELFDLEYNSMTNRFYIVKEYELYD